MPDADSSFLDHLAIIRVWGSPVICFCGIFRLGKLSDASPHGNGLGRVPSSSWLRFSCGYFSGRSTPFSLQLIIFHSETSSYRLKKWANQEAYYGTHKKPLCKIGLRLFASSYDRLVFGFIGVWSMDCCGPPRQ